MPVGWREKSHRHLPVHDLRGMAKCSRYGWGGALNNKNLGAPDYAGSVDRCGMLFDRAMLATAKEPPLSHYGTERAIAGLLPTLWGSCASSEVMKRIAAPMVGGMFTPRPCCRCWCCRCAVEGRDQRLLQRSNSATGGRFYLEGGPKLTMRPVVTFA